ncbi:alkanesulfonate monooxygenase SsuD/methylene tetrahydromethanopterin reductase-like flavin-dependent oxidoreductase (luciferase family) [Arthrobacter stackebrandtii]|uniref:Alkanesulfonate monooxygenase SsuD/methylene tetrahydromethanopterin reductase-like flavin-dependent oxidoreductase (Luciferase family) n=1 Tax=Arthrobacter stackebrandtii TaxID=272161 RepID=A0ABS4Z0E0_9MICC|nr:LLM class flavin-dependent oxidoreductase [Arthrobacter stackebrandtii]MBP2414521.1 alkanesulfonate monooxygenase SsuD/methylene tetrahydromethanopterin reductase-like flavin-dependent oxidoreductase (luciferase family) [Arthrobacter stackebrandtii]PYH01858.1 LLM class flavin-dependent oxidoreductase [Arthrobacter stackebrandtii]
MEIGAYSFGDTPRNDDGTHQATAGGIRNLFDAIVHADKQGLDYFGVGEHHTVSMPASSPGAMLAAASAATKNIILGSAASIISTDDPVRVFQQMATADAVSGGGRIEITAGRGSSVETFPLFGYELRDYDRLYSEKLELLLALNNAGGENVSWSGSVRPAIDNLAVVPRPVQGQLPVWIATGGSPASSARAGALGLPVSYGIIGGAPHRFAPLAELYRQSAAQAGHSGANIKVSVAALGLVARTKKEALERFYPGWHNLSVEMGRLRGWPAPDRGAYLAQADAPGAYYVGDPDEVARRIVDLHGHMGHMRHFLQSDIGGLPQEHFLESITLLAQEVKPRVDRLLARK